MILWMFLINKNEGRVRGGGGGVKLGKIEKKKTWGRWKLKLEMN